MVYSLTNDSSVIRDADGACIPPDDRNADWRDYQAWLALGNTPTPYVAPPPLDALGVGRNQRKNSVQPRKPDQGTGGQGRDHGGSIPHRRQSPDAAAVTCSALMHSEGLR
jgi:hypothetical protein